MAGAYTFKYGEIECLSFEPNSYVNYAISLPIELNSHKHCVLRFIL